MNQQKTVLITGCSSGFGRQMVTRFLEDGWIVFATMRQMEKRREIFAEELKTYGERLILMNMEVTSASERKALAEAIGKKGLGLDCLINNAGFMLLGALENTSEEQVRKQFEVNFFGPVFLIQELLPFLRQKKGIIINLSSVFGFLTWPLSSIYCASKYALEAVSESLWQELRAQEIRVVIFEPGSHGGTALADNQQWAELSKEPLLYERAIENYKNLRKMQRDDNKASTDKVAKAAVRVAGEKSPSLKIQFGKGMSLAYRLTRWFPELIGVRLMSWVVKKAFGRAEKAK